MAVRVSWPGRRTLESVEEVAPVVIGDVGDAIQLVGRQTEFGPAPLPPEQWNRGQRGCRASPADSDEPFGVLGTDGPFEPAQRLGVLAALLQQLGDQLSRPLTGGLGLLQRPKMCPRVGIGALLEADLSEAVPGEAGVLITESEHLAQQAHRMIDLARALPLVRCLQQDLTPLLGIADDLLLQLIRPRSGVVGQRHCHGSGR